MINQKKFSFTRQLRLLARRQFDVVFQRAKRVSSPYMTLLYRVNDQNHPRVGFVVAKKSLPKAVHRNTFKRIARESFRRHQHALPSVDIVIIAKKGLKCFDRAELLDQLVVIWSKIGRK